MSLTGGKRKVNKSLKAWVAFVKKVQKQEKLSYKDAIHRAKQRKDKGEKWMSGGDEGMTTSTSLSTSPSISPIEAVEETIITATDGDMMDGMMEEDVVDMGSTTGTATFGGSRRARGRARGRGRSMRRTMRRGRSMGRSMGRGRGRSMRRTMRRGRN